MNSACASRGLWLYIRPPAVERNEERGGQGGKRGRPLYASGDLQSQLRALAKISVMDDHGCDVPLSLSEAGAVAGVSRSCVENWCRLGHLESWGYSANLPRHRPGEHANRRPGRWVWLRDVMLLVYARRPRGYDPDPGSTPPSSTDSLSAE